MTIFAIVLGIVYLMVGGAKLAGVKRLADQFDEFGLGRKGMLAVGALEVAAAVGLQVDTLNTFAAAGMVVTMIGAIFFHNQVGHAKDQSIPATVVLIASLVFVALSV